MFHGNIPRKKNLRNKRNSKIVLVKKNVTIKQLKMHVQTLQRQRRHSARWSSRQEYSHLQVLGWWWAPCSRDTMVPQTQTQLKKGLLWFGPHFYVPAPTCCSPESTAASTKRISEVTIQGITLSKAHAFLQRCSETLWGLIASGEERMCFRPCHRQPWVRVELHHLSLDRPPREAEGDQNKLMELPPSPRVPLSASHPRLSPILPVPGGGNATAHLSTPPSQIPQPPSWGGLPPSLPPPLGSRSHSTHTAEAGERYSWAGCKETALAPETLLVNSDPGPKGRGTCGLE